MTANQDSPLFPPPAPGDPCAPARKFCGWARRPGWRKWRCIIDNCPTHAEAMRILRQTVSESLVMHVDLWAGPADVDPNETTP